MRACVRVWHTRCISSAMCQIWSEGWDFQYICVCKKKKVWACMCDCTHVSGTPAGLWEHTWVFHGEVAVLHHMLGSHTPWHIPLRSDKKCVCVCRVDCCVFCVLMVWHCSLMQVAPQSENPSSLDAHLCLVPPPAAPPCNPPFPSASHRTSPTHIAPPPTATRAPC